MERDPSCNRTSPMAWAVYGGDRKLCFEHAHQMYAPNMHTVQGMYYIAMHATVDIKFWVEYIAVMQSHHHRP